MWAYIPPHRRRLSLETVVNAVSTRSCRSESADSSPFTPTQSAAFAVLVLLYEHEGETCVVLTRRAPHLRRHPGEVAFPGGRREPGDSDLWATALREATEETSLDPTGVRCIGRLGNFTTVTSHSRWVCPFVAVVDRRPLLRPAPDEVEAVLHVRLSELLADEAWHEEIWELHDHQERIMTFFELPGDTVWGATAAVLRQLLEIATTKIISG